VRLITYLFLTVASVLLLLHYLPQLYWLLNPFRHRAPVVFYSAVSEQFLFLRLEDGAMQRRDAHHQPLEREEFEALLPLNFSAQLSREGRMPENILGREITAHALREGRFNLRINPLIFDAPSVPLYPLLEADSGRVRLEAPREFVRMGADVTILDPATNSVLEEKTATFRMAFQAAGFQFPVLLVGTNPTTLKPYDEGFFLLDARQSLFHFQQRRGEPFVEQISDPSDLLHQESFVPLGIFVQEQETREFRCLLVGRDGRLLLVLGPDYKINAVDLESYNPRRDQLAIRGDMLHRIITVTGEDFLEALVVDRQLDPVARYEENFLSRNQQPAAQWAQLLFPFTLDWQSPFSTYLNFYFHPGGWAAALLWTLLAGSLIFAVRILIIGSLRSTRSLSYRKT
jgi:hypothetical protein